ncbi:MFS transporter [Streptomyces sp. PU-14G]|uniref:MFS transporter n=1 Tax=Streptomyces sp. PU-14G TaxID=2800808 RepID=UPI0034DFB8A6
MVAAQALSGVGLAAGVTVGALLAQDMLGSTGLAGLLSALSIAGSALAAVAVGRISQARGRRPGLSSGYLAGALGSAGVIVAALADSTVLLFAAMFVYGAGTATNLLARYAGADLAAPEHRARALSAVLVATAVGGVVGPSLAAPAGDLAQALGLPRLTGLFLLSGAAYAAAALVLAIWLRPDPLLLARALAAKRPAAAYARPAEGGDREGDGDGQGAENGDGEGDGDGDGQGVGGGAGAPARPPVRRYRSGVLVGTLVMALTQVVMVAIMTMTPIHLHEHGHSSAASGLVIALHVGAMYLPAPLSGWLVDRYGRLTGAVAASLVLLAAGAVAAGAPGGSVAMFAVALALLGVGWSLGLVSGTALITDAVPPATRAKTQGSVDVFLALAGATGGMASGVVVAGAGYPVLATAGGVVALAIVPTVLATARSTRHSPQ